MARKRDIVIGVIIGLSFLVAIVFFGLIFLAAMFPGDDVTLAGFGEKVAVIDVYGTIYNSENVVRQLKKYGRAGNIDAVVLHINSPGGGVAPSQEIYNEILRVRDEEGKIVVVSMGSMAASGGYLIACAADKIVANPGTMTGSIGVIISFPTAGKLFEKIGIAYETVKSGELKDVGTMDRRMTENERKMLTSVIMDTYEQFVDIVCEGRGLEREEVYRLANGSIFTGRQAYTMNLVDTLGGFEDAIRIAADMAGISGEPGIIKERDPQPSIWDLMGSFMGKVENLAGSEVGGPSVMYLY
nr:signal peptide peptidase SppA [candidate division Zixibacteria bacterium]